MLLRDGPMLPRGWSHAAQRMVPCCSEVGPLLLRGWPPAAQRMVPCCSEDGPLLLRGWSPAAQRMAPCCSEDGHQDGPLVRLSSSVIMLLSDILEHCIQTAAGILRMVTMKSMSVYQHLHLRRRSKQRDY